MTGIISSFQQGIMNGIIPSVCKGNASPDVPKE
jgi:hypothetical protein